MSTDLGRPILEDFLTTSRPCIEALVRALQLFKGDAKKKCCFYYIKDGSRTETVFDEGHFFLRTSVEYSNPHLTVEEVQGIVTARLLEVCGNYYNYYGLNKIKERDIDEIWDQLNKPSLGTIVSFLLNTDDVEPDRYSMNPLRESIVNSGQSAFPSASVKTESLEIDQKFLQKYEGSLISKDEADLINHHLGDYDSYVDMVEAVKYEQLQHLSESFGICLSLPSLRMPLKILEEERTDGWLHSIIGGSHRDYESIETIYNCMGRSMRKRTTLLTVPHSKEGYGSKRAARGKLYFTNGKLRRVKVKYRTTSLYPNAIDPDDISVAKAQALFSVKGEQLSHYAFEEIPSSPQFILYSIGSPEDATLWHGIGAFGASQLVKSFISTRLTCINNSMFKDLKEKYGVKVKTPLQFNLIPQKMWFHPIHRNIDASIGCVEDLRNLVKLGITIDQLSPSLYTR